VIFSRGRRGRHSRGDGPDRSGRDVNEPVEELADEPEDERSVGPYDVSEAPPGVERIDLGSLKIPAVSGVEVRVQASPDGAVQQVVLVHGDSALQLGAYAAPRSEGIWDEIRAELRSSLTGAQSVQEIDGAYGTELRARVRTPEGQVELRFLGIEGPRWMVQALFQGRAAVDPSAVGPLGDCLEGLVVERGKEAMPVRDLLPLRLPRDLAEQAGQAGTPTDAPGLPAAPTVGPGPTIGLEPGATPDQPQRPAQRAKQAPRRRRSA
jgi:hypothetical protein